MTNTHVNPTRMELTKKKKKLAIARKGHKLLKDKRDELMRQFVSKVSENKDLRIRVEEGIKTANKLFFLARAEMQENVLDTALILPKQHVFLKVTTKNIMSVAVPEYKYTTRTPDPNDIYPYGLAFTSGVLDEAIKELQNVFNDMLKLAESEKACKLMASEIEKTRRRVNALEHIVIPESSQAIKYITMKLDENERSSQVRLMKL